MIAACCRQFKSGERLRPISGGSMRQRTVALAPLAVVALSVTAATGVGARPARVTLLFTSDTLGELVPCGCARRGGGLARRAGLVRQLRASFPDLIVLETGNLARTPEQLAV